MKGDLLDPVVVEEAMKGVDKLFLLNAVTADELTQASITFGLARKLKLKHLTHLSVFKVEQFRDVPHFASKLAVESALREFEVPHTILRPGYYLQNDATLKDALTGPGIYPIRSGQQGLLPWTSATSRRLLRSHSRKTDTMVRRTTLSGRH